jgi:4-amino-4-deoxy-L-arabinose transferase-like glycosyltransferase
VFLLALVLRLAWCTLATVTPISDCAGYHKLACTLLATGQLHHSLGEAWRTPAYPGFLAGVYALFGENVRAAALVQSLLGALSAAAVVWLASLVASPRTSLLAGVLQAVWPTAVVYTPVLVSENLASPLLLLALVCIAWGGRGNQTRAAALLACAGVLFGLLLLVRPANSFFAPAILLLLLYDFARRRWRLILPLVFVVCALLTVAPWLIRNDRLGLGPFTLSTQGGLALWWGNNPETEDGTAEPPRFPEAEQLGEVTRDRFYREKALAWIRDHPRRYLALCGVRAVRFLGKQPDWFAAQFAWPTPDNDRAIRQRYEAATYRQDVPNQRIDYAQALENRHMRYELRLRRAVAPLILLALVWSLFRWRQWAPVNLPALSYSIGLTLTVFLERFRILSDPLFLIVFAALLADVVFGTRDLGGGRVARVAKAALAILLVTASVCAHKARLDKRWYDLAPAQPPQTAPSATRLADPVSICAGAPLRAPAGGTPPLYDLSTWN